MELINNFSIIESSFHDTVLLSEPAVEKKEKKTTPLRANVFLSFAVLGTMSLSQVNAASNFDIKNFEEIQSISLKCTEDVISKISKYSNELNRISHFNKFQFVEKVIAFRSLENSWDGYNALPTGIKCATNAIKIIDALDIRSLEKIGDIFPNPNGTITLEWENNLDEVISLEVGKDTFTYFVDFNSLETKFYNKQAVSFENIKILKEYISAI